MHTIYVFDDFELDRARFELRCGGERVMIQPKVLHLLFYLVAHQGRAIANEELFTALWPTVTVCRGSLKRAVRGARRALGDDGARQWHIRTLRGYGYAFLPRAVYAAPSTEAHVGDGARWPQERRETVWATNSH